MNLPFSLTAAGIAEASLSSEDIIALRRAVWQDGIISREEASAILDLNARIAAPSPEWTAFYVEAMCAWLIEQVEPRGHVDEVGAQWLCAAIGRDGRRPSLADIELIVRLLEKAESTPAGLREFAMAAIERAIVEPAGPAESSDSATPRVDAREAGLLRRLVFAAGGGRPAGVGKAEAEMLFRIKDAALRGENAPEWKQLFVQGVGNYLQGTGGARTLPRAHALESERFTAERPGGANSFPSHLSGGHGGLTGAFRDALGLGDEAHRHDGEAETGRAEAIGPSQQAWLDDAINADGEVDAYEQALRDFLTEE